MWPDNDIDKAFQRLDPPDPEPASFPLDAWLRLEKELDKTVIEQAVRQKLWRYFAAEVAIVALVAAGWFLWPTGPTEPAGAGTVAGTTAATKEATSASATNGSAKKPSRGATAQPRLSTTAPKATATAPPAPAVADAHATRPAATTPAPPAPRAAQLNSPRLLATVVVPDAPRRPARKNLSPAENMAIPKRVAAGTAASSAPRRTLREAEGVGHYSPRKTVEPAGSSPTAAAATSAVAAATRTGVGTAEPSSISSAPSNFATRRDDAPGGQPRNTAQAAKTAEETVAGQVSTSTSLPENPGTEARSAGAEAANLTALALRPVALQAGVAPEFPMPLGGGAMVSLPTEAPLPVAARQPRFYLGVVAAPDVTTVKFASVQSPLLNVGVTLEYRLTNRLRLTTGLLRSTKQYTAHREDYDWGAFSTQVAKYDFKDVEGTCQVLDVPLNLRYDVLTQPQYKVFGSLGLSSFFMQRERYSYPYVYQNMPHYAEWELVNANRHLFSIANLSVGYERSLSSRWSLQAEPYLKLPLGGVGAGKVRLVSGGIFFGAKYGF